MAGMERCCRLETYRYALYTNFQEPKLFRLAARGDWDMIPDRARSHPKEAAFVHRYAPMDTALHRILRPTSGTAAQVVVVDAETQHEMTLMKLKAVAALLEANRQATLIQDSFGRTPLHLACMDISNGGDEAALMIIHAIKDRAAACAPDMEGRTPLHYLVARNDFCCHLVDAANNNNNNNNNTNTNKTTTTNSNKNYHELITKLVALSPAALAWKDVVGETPMDIVASRRGEWSHADEMLKVLYNLQHEQQQQQLQQQQQHHQHHQQQHKPKVIATSPSSK